MFPLKTDLYTHSANTPVLTYMQTCAYSVRMTWKQCSGLPVKCLRVKFQASCNFLMCAALPRPGRLQGPLMDVLVGHSLACLASAGSLQPLLPLSGFPSFTTLSCKTDTPQKPGFSGIPSIYHNFRKVAQRSQQLEMEHFDHNQQFACQICRVDRSQHDFHGNRLHQAQEMKPSRLLVLFNTPPPTRILDSKIRTPTSGNSSDDIKGSSRAL